MCNVVCCIAKTLIQVSCLHLQELIDRDAGAESRDDDTEEEDRATVMASSCQPNTLINSGSWNDHA